VPKEKTIVLKIRDARRFAFLGTVVSALKRKGGEKEKRWQKERKDLGQESGKS
jgi:hypothetical protein